MSTRHNDPVDFSSIKRDSKNIAFQATQLTVDFSVVPAKFENEFPNKTVVFTDAQVFETPSLVVFSAVYAPAGASYWEFLISTPKLVGSYNLETEDTRAQVQLRHGGSDMHPFANGTVRLQAYAPGTDYEVDLTNVGQQDVRGFQVSHAWTSSVT